ncbi:uridine diphosphate-N-acetylglucosamine-binding protein YvcK, partial [Candidatus Omnitrophota bacterium]
FDAAIKESSKVLAIRGSVVPSTLEKVTLFAEHLDGSRSVGESNIPEAKSPVKRVNLMPKTSRPTNEAVDAIRKSDVIVLGPGSLYTSIIPNLLVKGIYHEIVRSRAIKIYICNVMTQKGETAGYKASDHLKAILDHAGPGVVTYCVVNTAKVPDNMLDKYKEQDSYPVIPDIENIKKMRCRVVEGNLISAADFVRHDSVKLARVTMDLIAGVKKFKI